MSVVLLPSLQDVADETVRIIAETYQIPVALLQGRVRPSSETEEFMQRIALFVQHHKEVLDDVHRTVVERMIRQLQPRKSKGFRRHVRRTKQKARRR